MSSGAIAGEPTRIGVDALTPGARRWAFGTVMLAFVLDITDSTIVNTALPTIQTDLAASTHTIQWVVAGYFLSFAVLLVAGGRLGDLYGYRRMFLLGVGGFTLASLACGLARSGGELTACRLVQGAAAAIMAPQVMALVQLMFTPLERVAKLAVFGIVGGLAAIGGPILGGLLIAANLGGLGWRPIFLVNGPVGVAALLAGWWLLPEGRSPHALRPDPVGTLLLGGALVSLLWPLIGGQDKGSVWQTVALLACSAALLALFWRHATARVARHGSALIAPELFAERSFSLGLAITLTFGTAAAGWLLVLSIVLQRGLGYSPLQTALAHAPFGAGVMLGIGLIGRRALPRFGRRVPAAGAALMAAGCLGVGIAAFHAATLWLLLALVLAGIGMGTVVGPLTPITLARVDRGHAGVAGGMQGAVQQVGGALGSAVIGTLFFSAASVGNSPGAFLAALTPALGGTIGLLLGVVGLALMLPDPIFPADPRTMGDAD